MTQLEIVAKTPDLKLQWSNLDDSGHPDEVGMENWEL